MLAVHCSNVPLAVDTAHIPVGATGLDRLNQLVAINLWFFTFFFFFANNCSLLFVQLKKLNTAMMGSYRDLSG